MSDEKSRRGASCGEYDVACTRSQIVKIPRGKEFAPSLSCPALDVG